MAIRGEGTDKGSGRRPVAFISHHSSQEKTARHLKEILERNDIEGWMAPDDIEPGRPFDEAIVAEVEHCDMIVLLFCAKSDRSRHVKRELMMAENHRKLIYPVRLEDIDAKGLAYWLNDYQWIDWIDRRDATIERLIDTIKRQVRANEPVVEEEAAETTESGGAALADDGGSPTPMEKPIPPEPAPADMAPMTLAGTMPPQPPDDQGTVADGKSRFALTSTSWIIIVVVGVIFLLAIVMAIGASNNAGGGPELRPGQWDTRIAFTDIDMPGSAPAIVNQVRSEFNPTEETNSACLTQSDSENPNLAPFTGSEFDDACEAQRSTFSGGDIELVAQCTVPGIEGPADTTVEGRYNATRLEADIRMQMNSPYGRFTLIGTLEARRTGDCN